VVGDGDVVGGDDDELVDFFADFGGEGVQAAVWLFGCADAGGCGGDCGAVGLHGGRSGCLVGHLGNCWLFRERW
jgi:hypothetical protein